MIELIVIEESQGGAITLSKVMVNPRHVVSIQETQASKQFKNKLMNDELDLRTIDPQYKLNKRINFSEVKMYPTTGHDTFIVVGTPYMIMEKMNKQSRQLLKG